MDKKMKNAAKKVKIASVPEGAVSPELPDFSKYGLAELQEIGRMVREFSIVKENQERDDKLVRMKDSGSLDEIRKEWGSIKQAAKKLGKRVQFELSLPVKFAVDFSPLELTELLDHVPYDNSPVNKIDYEDCFELSISANIAKKSGLSREQVDLFEDLLENIENDEIPHLLPAEISKSHTEMFARITNLAKKLSSLGLTAEELELTDE